MNEPLIPCIEVPKLGPDLQVRLPTGGALTAVRDFSKGIPDDCTLTANLMVQLPPLLGSMDCLLKILKAMEAMKSWIEDSVGPPPNPMALVTGAGDVINALGDLAPCFLIPTPLGIAPFIKDILLMIIAMLECLIDAVQSLLDFQLRLDFESAEGNPVLMAELVCAQENAQETMAHTLAALGPIESLTELLAPLLEIVGQELVIPPVDELIGAEDTSASLQTLEDTIGQIKMVVEALPI